MFRPQSGPPYRRPARIGRCSRRQRPARYSILNQFFFFLSNFSFKRPSTSDFDSLKGSNTNCSSRRASICVVEDSGQIFFKGQGQGHSLESSLQATKLSRVLFWKDLAKKVVIFFFILIRLKLKIWEGFPKSSINFCLLVSTTCNNLRMPLCVYFSCGYPVPFTPVPSGLLFHCKARK